MLFNKNGILYIRLTGEAIIIYDCALQLKVEPIRKDEFYDYSIND